LIADRSLGVEISERLEQQRRLLEGFKSKTPEIVLDRIATLEAEIVDLRAELREIVENPKLVGTS
jgi:hypothetical protein